MKSLKYRCPSSNHEVETSIRTDEDTLGQMHRMQLSLWCPHCKDSHAIRASEAYLDFRRVWKAA